MIIANHPIFKNTHIPEGYPIDLKSINTFKLAVISTMGVDDETAGTYALAIAHMENKDETLPNSIIDKILLRKHLTFKNKHYLLLGILDDLDLLRDLIKYLDETIYFSDYRKVYKFYLENNMEDLSRYYETNLDFSNSLDISTIQNRNKLLKFKEERKITSPEEREKNFKEFLKALEEHKSNLDYTKVDGYEYYTDDIDEVIPAKRSLFKRLFKKKI